jgi:hypothetical protein
MKRFAIALVAICVACQGYSQDLAQQADNPLAGLPASAKKAYETNAKKIQKNRETYESQNEKVLAGLQKELEKINPPVNVDAVIGHFQQGIMALDANAKPPAPPPPEKGVLVFNGHRYKLVQENLKWTDAKSKCEEMGGHLLTVEDATEQEFIQKALHQFLAENKLIPRSASVWLGIHQENGKWLTVDGQPQVFSQWDGGKFDPNFSYAHMNIQYSVWRAVPDEVLVGQFFICEWDK